MNLTFQIPMQYCSLQHQTLLPSLVTSTTGCCFCFGSISSFFLELFFLLISSGILGTYRPGEFIFQCPIFLPFHTVHGVLKARILKWFAIPFSRRWPWNSKRTGHLLAGNGDRNSCVLIPATLSLTPCVIWGESLLPLNLSVLTWKNGDKRVMG